MRGDLIALPVYSKSYKQYYKNADKKLAKTMKYFEDAWARVSQSLPEERKIAIHETYYDPPWKFNDIIGYIQIYWDLGRYITGHIFLKLKNIPKSHYKKSFNPPQYSTTIKNNQIFYFTEIPKISIENIIDNTSIIESISSIIKDGQSMLKKINKKWNVQSLAFPLDCIDFIKVFNQIKDNRRRS